VKEKPKLEMTIPTDIRLFGTQGVITIKYSANADYKCLMNFTESSVKDQNFELKSKASSVDVPFTLSESKRDYLEYSAKVICTLQDYTFTKDMILSVEQYPSSVVSISPSSINLTKRKATPTLKIENTIDEPIEIEITFEKGAAEEYIVLDKQSFILDVGASETVSFINTIPKKENISFTDTAVISAFGQVSKVTLNVDVVYIPFFKSKTFKIILFSTIAVTFIILLLLINYYLYYIRDYSASTWQNFRSYSHHVRDKTLSVVPKKIRDKMHIHVESDEVIDDTPQLDHSGVASIIKIMLSMNKDEADIKKRLKKEGLSEEEIKDALEVVHQELADKEELDKEESIIKVIKKMDEDSEYVRGVLKQSGFSDTQINQAFEEMEHEVENKEKDLQEKLKKITGEEETEAVSLLDIEKQNASKRVEKTSKKK
jgi:uncharacterized protein Smg (DUF494 family)